MEVADRDRRPGASAVAARLGAAQHRPDAGDHLGAAERLDHVVVGAELEADDAVGLGAAGGEDDDRDARAGADRAADVAAVAVGQVEVEQDQVGVELLRPARAPARPCAATCGSKPSRASAFENGSEIERSSSTNRMRGRSGIAIRRNVEERCAALPRFNPALAGAWRVGVHPARHEAITQSHRRRGDRCRPRRPRHRRPRLRRGRRPATPPLRASRRPRCGPRSSARPSAAAAMRRRAAPPGDPPRRAAPPLRPPTTAVPVSSPDHHRGRGRDDDGVDDHGGHDAVRGPRR